MYSTQQSRNKKGQKRPKENSEPPVLFPAKRFGANSLSDEVTEGSTEVTQSPTVLYRSDESLRVASSVLASQGGGRALRAKPFCGEKCGAPVAPGLMEAMRLTPQIRSSSMRSKDLFDRLLSFFVPT